jgi:regulator of CtrA degradation
MPASLAVYTRTYDEAFDLIVEARDFAARSRSASSLHTLKVNCEALRVTSRLTQVMAWLMIQRAVTDGEISAQQGVAAESRLSGQSVCLDCSSNDDRNLPAGLRSLLRRSFRLYQRIARLEEMVVARVLH